MELSVSVLSGPPITQSCQFQAVTHPSLTVLLNCGDPMGTGVTEQFIIWLVLKGLGHQPVSDNWVKLEIYF
jgi:hypothetical protein